MALALGAVAALGAAALLGRTPSSGSTAGPGPHLAGERAVEVATDLAPGAVPVGRHEDRGPSGAEAAAVRFLLLGQRLVAMDEGEASVAVRATATAAGADALVADILRRLGTLREAFPGGPVVYRVGPVASRVSMVGQDRATVEIWYVGVVSPHALPPYEEWRTARYELAWERGGWRQGAASTTAGPRPYVLPRAEPSGPGELESALSGFGPIEAPR